MFGCEEYTNQELREIIIERLPDCERVQLEWAAAIVSMSLPAEKVLAKVYQFTGRNANGIQLEPHET